MLKTKTTNLPPDVMRDRTRAAKAKGGGRSDVVRASMKRGLFIRNINAVREWAVPKAQAMDVFTDEDVFKIVS